MLAGVNGVNLKYLSGQDFTQRLNKQITSCPASAYAHAKAAGYLLEGEKREKKVVALASRAALRSRPCVLYITENK